MIPAVYSIYDINLERRILDNTLYEADVAISL
jgi:hypothetical protein